MSEFTKNKRSRDGLAFYCREHLAERSARSREARRVQPRKHRFPPRGTVVPNGHTWCPDCGEVKLAEDFPRTVASRTGRVTYCLPCHNLRSKASRDKLGGSRTYHLTRRYGISAVEADLMLEAQNGLCAICEVAEAQHVDHDHSTGRVRRLLCFNCNGGLGQFKDDPAVLRAAADYVERHRDLQRRRPSPLRRRRVEVTSRPAPASPQRRPAYRRSGLCTRGRARLAFGRARLAFLLGAC